MSSIVACGDIHGETFWQQIVKQESCLDRMIFMGDYFDPYREISFDDMIDNFYEIINFKKKYPEQVTLLLGNHDHHYLKGFPDSYKCSRYAPQCAVKIQIMFTEELDLFQICHIEDGYLFSHAGISNTWCKRNNVNLNDLQNSINNLFSEHHDHYGAFRFSFDDMSMYGNHRSQSPFWIRPVALASDMVEGYTQVIGHTSPRAYEKHIVDDLEAHNKIILTDTCSQCIPEPIDGLRHSYYYVFKDGIKTTKQVEW